MSNLPLAVPPEEEEGDDQKANFGVDPPSEEIIEDVHDHGDATEDEYHDE